MKTRSYFIDVRLEGGEWVTLVYDSSSRKGTQPHRDDFYLAMSRSGHDLQIDNEFYENFLHGTFYGHLDEFAYILNDKNKVEEEFGMNRIIDLRK